MSHSFRRSALVAGLRTSDLLVMAMSLALARIAFARDPLLALLELVLPESVRMMPVLLLLGLAAAWHSILRAQGLYRSRRLGSLRQEAWAILKSVTAATLLLSGVVMFLEIPAHRGYLATFWLFALLGMLANRGVLRLALGQARRQGRNLRNILVVGCGPRGAHLGAQIRRRPELGYNVLGYVDDFEPPVDPESGVQEAWLGRLDDAHRLLEQLELDEVIVALPVKSHYDTIAEIIASAEELGTIVRIPAVDFFRAQLAVANVDYFDQTPILTLQTPRPSSLRLAQKRVLDAAGAAAALIVLAPVFVVIALAIRLDSRGPVLFRQDRIGRGRRRFRMLKFRTMVIDAESRLRELEAYNEVKGAAFKMSNDPRVTRVGRLLRRWSLDELPQFWNVLVGHMSIVGPRPLPVRDLAQLKSRAQKRRFSVKPGLTCLWQAGGRHALSFEDWMRLDLEYIDNWSLGLDFRLMFRTIPAVLRGTGAS